MENKLIYNQLKSVPKDCLKTIQAGRLKGMSDIKPQWRIERMTEVFGVCGFGWKVSNLKFDYKNGSDNQIVCTCYLDLFVKLNDVWSDAIPGVGGSSFIANERNGLYTSDEAEKMAYTDALSVAMKMIGVAADVYMGHGGKHDAPQPTAPQQTPKPDLIAGTENCQKVVTYLAGGGKIEEVLKKYNISETLLKQLTK